MAELARVTNGQFYDADSPETLPAIFASELEGLQKISVQNLRVRIQPMLCCENYSLLGEYPALKLPDGRMEYAIGDLVSEEERIVCFGLKVLPLPLINGQPAFDLKGEDLLHVEVLWDELLEKGIVSRTLTQQIKIQATQDPAEVVVNALVAPWVSMQKAGAVMAEATKKMDTGNQKEAIAVLDHAIKELGQYGVHGVEAAKVLQELKSKIEGEQWSLQERKSAHYRSASFLKMSSHDMWTSKCAAPSFKQKPLAQGGNPKAKPASTSKKSK